MHMCYLLGLVCKFCRRKINSSNIQTVYTTSFTFDFRYSRYATEGFRDGSLVGGDGAEREMIKRITDLRAEYFSIGDLCAGRMPLAYVQFVQILVDSLVWLAPLSLYSGLGSLSIPLCAVLTHFFKGLLELSKSFLDPFGNDG